MLDPILLLSSGSSGGSAHSRIDYGNTASELTSDLPTSMDRLNQLSLLPICNYLCHTTCVILLVSSYWCQLHIKTNLAHVQYLV